MQYPNLANATPSGIVDMCGPDQEEYNRLKKITDFLKTGLKARLTDEYKILNTDDYEVRGEKYCATITQSLVSRLDLEKVRSILTPEQFESCLTSGPQTTVRFSKLE
jgi:hypothetical protein